MFSNTQAALSDTWHWWMWSRRILTQRQAFRKVCASQTAFSQSYIKIKLGVYFPKELALHAARVPNKVAIVLLTRTTQQCWREVSRSGSSRINPGRIFESHIVVRHAEAARLPGSGSNESPFISTRLTTATTSWDVTNPFVMSDPEISPLTCAAFAHILISAATGPRSSHLSEAAVSLGHGSKDREMTTSIAREQMCHVMLITCAIPSENTFCLFSWELPRFYWVRSGSQVILKWFPLHSRHFRKIFQLDFILSIMWKIFWIFFVFLQWDSAIK